MVNKSWKPIGSVEGKEELPRSKTSLLICKKGDVETCFHMFSINPRFLNSASPPFFVAYNCQLPDHCPYLCPIGGDLTDKTTLGSPVTEMQLKQTTNTHMS